jgi:hypothetical protein
MTQSPAYTHGTFCWSELGTRNAAAAKQFYTKLLGWQADDQPMPGGGTYTMMKLDGQDVGGLYEMSGEQFEGVPPHWQYYVWVDDVDAVAGKAVSAGGQMLAPPMDIPEVGRMAVLLDPAGAAFALFKGSGHQGAARVAPAPGSFSWNELMTTNAAGAKSFYATVFGWTPNDQPMEGMTYTVFNNGDQMAAGMMQMDGDQWAGVPPNWMGYISVADCDATAALASELGGTVQVPPTDIPTVGRFAVIQDPTGAVFAVITFVMPEEGA